MRPPEGRHSQQSTGPRQRRCMDRGRPASYHADDSSARVSSRLSTEEPRWCRGLDNNGIDLMPDSGTNDRPEPWDSSCLLRIKGLMDLTHQIGANNDSDQSVGTACQAAARSISFGGQRTGFIAATAQFSGDALASFLSVFWVDVNADSCGDRVAAAANAVVPAPPKQSNTLPPSGHGCEQAFILLNSQRHRRRVISTVARLPDGPNAACVAAHRVEIYSEVPVHISPPSMSNRSQLRPPFQARNRDPSWA